jgi:hypothetical protein
MADLMVLNGKRDPSYPSVDGYVVNKEARTITPAIHYVLVGNQVINPNNREVYKVNEQFFYSLDDAFESMFHHYEWLVNVAQTNLDSLVAQWGKQMEKGVTHGTVRALPENGRNFREPAK